MKGRVMGFDYGEPFQAALNAARVAGDMIRREFHRGGGARGSGGHADIDEEAEGEIRKILCAVNPRWGYRGEETGCREPEAGEVHMWLVDPNDGTNPFLRGHRGSAVSIALLREGEPVLGVVYAPTAPDDRGDFFSWAEGLGTLKRNGVEVRSPASYGSSEIIFISQDGDRKSEINTEILHPLRFRIATGIAWRLALVAAGEGSAAVSLNGPSGYDYAGGHALLKSMGKALLNRQGAPITYSLNGSSHSDWVFGGIPDVAESLTKLKWHMVLEGSPPPREEYDILFPQKSPKIGDPEILDRGQGALIGQLAGDSLGSLVEFRSLDEIERMYPQGVRLLADGGTYNTLAGQPTDDSEMALMLARSIVKKGAYDIEEAARAYGYWFSSHPFDIGGTTARALSTLEGAPGKSARAQEAADRNSQANGSLMRISPLGIWGWRMPPDELAAYARRDSSLTHPNEVCRDSCAVFAIAVARAISRGESPETLYHFALEWANQNTCEAVKTAMREAGNSPAVDYLSKMGWVLIALQNAFYELRHCKSPEEGIVRTVMRGGDTDTNAAIAGALLGSVYGRSSFPLQWLNMLLSCRPVRNWANRPRPRAFWPVDALELAERLMTLQEG